MLLTITDISARAFPLVVEASPSTFSHHEDSSGLPAAVSAGLKLFELCFRLFVPLFGGLAEPGNGLVLVLRNASTVLVGKAKAVSGFRESVFCGLAIPTDRLLIVLGNPFTIRIHRPKAILCKCVTLVSRLSEPRCGLPIVSRDP